MAKEQDTLDGLLAAGEDERALELALELAYLDSLKVDMEDAMMDADMDGMWGETMGMWNETDMMEMDMGYACGQAQMLLSEIDAYMNASEEGKKQKEEQWQQGIEDSIKQLWEDMDMGAVSTTTFAAAVASVVALLSF